MTLVTAPTAEPLSLAEAKLHLRVDGTADDTLIPPRISSARQYVEDFTGRDLVDQSHKLLLDAFPSWVELPGSPLVSVTSVTYIDENGATQTAAASLYDVDITTEPGTLRLAFDQTWPSTRSTPNAVTINYDTGYVVPFTVNTTSDVFTSTARTFTDADIVRVHNSGGSDGALPAELAEKTDYHIRDVSGATFKLSAAAGGAAIDITAAGTGTHYIGPQVVPDFLLAAILLLVSHWYEHRDAVCEGGLAEVPLTVKDLLWLRKVMP